VTRLATASIISFASVAFAAGIGVGKPVVVDDTPALVAQLSDESFTVRESAQLQLTEAGEPLAAQLRSALSNATDEERRSRLEAILKQIGEDAIIGPSRVTIDCQDMPLEQVVAEINRQVRGSPISYPRENWNNTPGPTVTLHVRRQPLWAVLRSICEQTGTLDISPGDNGIRLSLGCGALTRAPAAVSGPLLIVASRITHQKSVEFTQGAQRSSDFAVHFTALAEPKLKIMPGAASVRLTEAVDDRGNSLLPPGSIDETYGGGSPFWSFQTRLRFPDNPGTQISSIAGQLTFNAASRFESIELTDLANARNAQSDIGHFRFIVRQVTQTNDNRFEVAVAAVAPPGEPEEFNRLQQLLYSAELRLLDTEGRSIMRSAGPNFTPSERGNTIEMTTLFDRNLSDGRPAAGPAHKLVWQIPVESKPLTVPFELKNLPLP